MGRRRDIMIIELGVSLLVVGAAGYVFWRLRAKKAALRRQVLRPEEEKLEEE